MCMGMRMCREWSSIVSITATHPTLPLPLTRYEDALLTGKLDECLTAARAAAARAEAEAEAEADAEAERPFYRDV